MLIRQEQPGDEGGIRATIVAAFAEAAHSNGLEAEIVDRLRSSGALVVSLVADEGGATIGYCAASRVCMAGEGSWYGIGPLAIRLERQNRGIGSALVETALQHLKGRGATGCVVVGDPVYYSRFGFRHDAGLTFGDVPPPYFQYLAFDGSRPAGEVRYDPAFGRD